MKPSPLEFIKSKFPGIPVEHKRNEQFTLKEVVEMLVDYKDLVDINKSAKEWLQENHPVECANLESKQLRGQVTKFMDDYVLSILIQ